MEVIFGTDAYRWLPVPANHHRNPLRTHPPPDHPHLAMTTSLTPFRTPPGGVHVLLGGRTERLG
jgi:hypothetical protein